MNEQDYGVGYADGGLEWKRPPVSPCAEYDFPCCSPDQCDAMQPSVSVVGARTIREALADPTEAQQ